MGRPAAADDLFGVVDVADKGRLLNTELFRGTPKHAGQQPNGKGYRQQSGDQGQFLFSFAECHQSFSVAIRTDESNFWVYPLRESSRLAAPDLT